MKNELQSHQETLMQVFATTFESLHPDEIGVIDLIFQGHSLEQIAKDLDLDSSFEVQRCFENGVLRLIKEPQIASHLTNIDRESGYHQLRTLYQDYYRWKWEPGNECLQFDRAVNVTLFKAPMSVVEKAHWLSCQKCQRLTRSMERNRDIFVSGPNRLPIEMPDSTQSPLDAGEVLAFPLTHLPTQGRLNPGIRVAAFWILFLLGITAGVFFKSLPAKRNDEQLAANSPLTFPTQELRIPIPKEMPSGNGNSESSGILPQGTIRSSHGVTRLARTAGWSNGSRGTEISASGLKPVFSTSHPVALSTSLIDGEAERQFAGIFAEHFRSNLRKLNVSVINPESGGNAVNVSFEIQPVADFQFKVRLLLTDSEWNSLPNRERIIDIRLASQSIETWVRELTEPVGEAPAFTVRLPFGEQVNPNPLPKKEANWSELRVDEPDAKGN